MQIETLKAEKRPASGKAAAKALRRKGLTPCVLYGRGTDTIPLAVPTLGLEAALRHGDRVLNIALGDGAPQPAFVKEVQYEVLSEKVLHVDFAVIRMDEKFEVEVSIRLKGTAAGIKEGGLVEHTLHTILVSCLPHQIPDEIVVDVTPMKVGDSWHVSDLKAPENVAFVTPSDSMVVTCHMPRGEEEEALPEEVVEPVRVGAEEEEEEAAEEALEAEVKPEKKKEKEKDKEKE
jgi:large subunit ribosomal protein L25